MDLPSIKPADNKLALRFLQIGLAFVFLYAATSAFISPDNWVGYLPGFTDPFISRSILLKLFSCFEIVLALWLLSSWKLFYSSLIAALMLAGITVFNLGILDVTFRDVGLIFAALALAALASKGK